MPQTVRSRAILYIPARVAVTAIKYINEKFLENDEVVKGLSDMSTYYKLSKIETIMGEKATTAFELEKEVSGWKLKTICPYCGIKLGDKSESNK